MTKKDYIKIASIIKDNTNKELKMNNTLNKYKFMNDLMDMFKEDNKNFDTKRFINACYDDE